MTPCRKNDWATVSADRAGFGINASSDHSDLGDEPADRLRASALRTLLIVDVV